MNDVESCYDVVSFLKKINSYEHTAFILSDREIKYKTLCSNAKKLANWIDKNVSQKYININANSAYHFSVVYLATLLAGKVAVLGALNDSFPDCFVLNLNRLGEIFEIEDELNSIEVDQFAVSTLVQSSGTTSHKKYVMLSQKNIFSDTISGMRNYEYSVKSRYVNIIPCTHLFGLVADLLGPLYSGGTICVLDNKYEFFGSLSKYNPSALNLPPIMIEQILNLLEKNSNNPEVVIGRKLKKIMCAGAPISRSVVKKMIKYGVQVYTAYGLTECSPCVSLSEDNYYREGSVGKVLDCCEVKIEDGEILVRGDNVMIGYYNAPKDTKEVLIDGWLHTGDLGDMDSDGYLFITGRKNTLLIFGNGYKVNPEEIEALINCVEGVVESEVFLLHDELKDKPSVRVHISNDVDKKIISEKVREIFNSHTEVNVEHILFTEMEFEKTELGKIKRSKL